MTIELVDDYSREKGWLDRVARRLAQPRFVSVCATPNPDHPGRRDAVLRFVELLLKRWPGVAEDGQVEYFWTLTELHDGRSTDGREFYQIDSI